jgi:GTP cyclohydrolase I
MKISEIYEFLNSKSPFELAEPWDNCGLLLGSMQDVTSAIVLSLDLSLETVREAKHGSLIITHHPFIFSALKRLDTGTTVGKIVKEAIKKDISIIAMHTNFDKSALNDYFVEHILGFETFEKDGFMAKIAVDMSFDEVVALAKSKLGLKNINCVAPKQGRVQTIGVTTGSGSELAFSSGCDVFMSGDVKYHTAFEAREQGVGLVDITHYASELCFSACMAKILKILPIEVIISNSKNPFETY